MELKLLAVSLILLFSAVGGIFSLIKQLQMLQQNSYFPSRYMKWVLNSYSGELAVNTFVFCVASLLFATEFYFAEAGLLGAFAIWKIVEAVNVQKTSIKKLVFTARVKRLLGAALIVFIILAVLFAIDFRKFTFCIVLAVLFGIVSPLLTLLIWALTKPIEWAFGKWYIADAKKILKKQKGLTVIGITGSYGKTTTKFILTRILSEKYNTLCTPQSFNTPMGVVRTIREQLKPQTQIFVCEMGAKNIGDIKEICHIVNPDHAIITSVGPQHLDTFKSVDNVFKTKFELADAVKKVGGKCLVNGECEEISNRISHRADVIPFGEGTEYFAENIKYSAQGSTFTLYLGGEKISVTTRLLGKHSVADIVAAAALAHILGVSASDIAFAISALKPTEHRLELKSFEKGSLLIDDAYNSNPVGCLEAVNILGSFEGMQKAIITPGLIELGEKEYESNYNLGLAAAKFCDIIILVGKNRSVPMRDAIATTDFNKDNLYIAGSFKEALDIYRAKLNSSSVLLIENDLPDNYLN
ncbi:MAG: UDP-N-acetylmuramoyl-tripeptide--D-alanyl-D-alanine ligase [Clostridia bacterium]|nr:UDP-N-acetylmuramoyl-tripeptide--D-alanyl-D-alanine ligase [Clostridia bacterium]